MTAVRFEHADVVVGGTSLLRDVSLDIADGEFLGVIGPSGSGKTTLLRAVAGLAEISRGTVRFDGVDMQGSTVAQRDVGMVFQNPVLLDHRTVMRNVSFPLEIRRQDVNEIRRRVGAEVRALHVEHLVGRRPSTLSRGEAQLVQIARTMVRTPKVLLLDEPLAALDPEIGRRMRIELRILQEGYGVTTIMTTNDAREAMEMPSRLAVLDAGRVVQVGTPAEVRRSPATLDAAMTTGECWTIPAVVEADTDGFWFVRSDPDSGATFRLRAWAPVLGDRIGEEILVGIRPDDVSVHRSASVSAVVTGVAPGQPASMLCTVAGRPLGVQANVVAKVGDPVKLRIDRVMVFDATSEYAIC